MSAHLALPSTSHSELAGSGQTISQLAVTPISEIRFYAVSQLFYTLRNEPGYPPRCYCGSCTMVTLRLVSVVLLCFNTTIKRIRTISIYEDSVDAERATKEHVLVMKMLRQTAVDDAIFRSESCI